jgi:hypothetical protein
MVFFLSVNGLFLGDVHTAHNYEWIKEKGILHILNISKEASPHEYITYIFIFVSCSQNFAHRQLGYRIRNISPNLMVDTARSVPSRPSSNEPKSRKPECREPSAERQAKLSKQTTRSNQKKQFSNLTNNITNPVYNSLNYGQCCRQ